ncbi:MAG: hypothetical protein ACLGHN_03480 [Bacteriovoracia bacterium]
MSNLKKILISAFIIFNFLIMARVHLPMNSKFFSALYRPVDPFLSFFSLYQTWTMFSPNPARTNSFITAEVLFDDNSKDTYVFPRASEMSIFEKYVNGERYRVITDAIRRDNNKFLWKDSAKFALRKLRSTNLHKIPLRVDLVRHWDIIPDMKTSFRPHLKPVKKYSSYKFYTHEVL